MTAGLAGSPGGHAPRRWSKTYAQRILDAPQGSLITLLWLEGRRAWVGLERTYGTTKPNTSGLTVDDVYTRPVTETALPPGRPLATAAGL